MSEKKIVPSEGKHGKVRPPQKKSPDKKTADGSAPTNPISDLQQQVGNRAVQRLVAQRQTGPAETDEATADEINQLRGSGQSLDGSVQREMGAKIGADFSGVSVHTSPQADDLNKRLGARAFTTGQDIYFRQGEYAPNSDGGKELLAHELTHVVQQRKGGDLEPATKMVVNPPDDAYEREADKVAKQVTGPAAVQAQEDEETLPAREEEVQAKRLDSQPLQRQTEEDDEQREEEVQAKRLESQPVQRQEEEEEMLQGKQIQRQEMREDEEELQAKRLESQPVQRQEEEEELAMPKAIQRASDVEEEEPLQGKRH